jgi:hypothetical protein
MQGVRWAPGEGGGVDPTLGRVVAPWTRLEADALDKALLRFGDDRADVVAEKVWPVAVCVV